MKKSQQTKQMLSSSLKGNNGIPVITMVKLTTPRIQIFAMFAPATCMFMYTSGSIIVWTFVACIIKR